MKFLIASNWTPLIIKGPLWGQCLACPLVVQNGRPTPSVKIKGNGNTMIAIIHENIFIDNIIFHYHQQYNLFLSLNHP